jgi:flagellar protein FlbD
MIWVSRLNGKKFVVNCEMIKFVEATPDTVITLSTGEKLMIRESVDEVIQASADYKQRMFREPPERATTGGG